MADDPTPQFSYRNPDGNGSLTCGWTKHGQFFVRPDMGWSGAVVVAREKAWELAKYLARDLPGGINAGGGDAIQLLEREIERITAENIELKARLMPHVAEPEPLTEEEVW